MGKRLVMILAVGLIVCAACAKAPLKPGDVKTQCMKIANNSRTDSRKSWGCEPGATDNICTAYKDVAAREHQSREECVDECQDVRQDMLQRYALAGCGESVKSGEQYCIRYCQDNYE